MRLKILIVFMVLAIVTGACGVATPMLSSGPNLSYNPEGSSPETSSSLPADPFATSTDNSQPVQQAAAVASIPFGLNPDSPRYLPAFTQPDAGCAWVGVAGQVFDQSGAPLEGVVVVVKGYFNGILLDAQTVSGLHQAYGQSGFEVKIGDLSADTNNALTIQLVNSKFEALSAVYPLTTYNDCQRNLILVNFEAQSDSWKAYLP